jgi:hypothetical protein
MWDGLSAWTEALLMKPTWRFKICISILSNITLESWKTLDDRSAALIGPDLSTARHPRPQGHRDDPHQPPNPIPGSEQFSLPGPHLFGS